MPYSRLSQLFSQGRGSQESRDHPVSRIVRRRSTSVLIRNSKMKSQVDLADDSTPARKLSNITTPTKKLLSHRGRSYTIHEISNKTKRGNKDRCADSAGKLEDNHRSSFKDFALGIVSSKRLRRNSVIGSATSPQNTSSPHRSCKTDRHQISPLATSQKCRHAFVMTRHAPNGIPYKQMTSSNGDETRESRDDDNHPASVEFLVRKCADCFDAEGKCNNEEYLRILFLTHLWFMTSEQLMVLFSQLYEEEKATEGYSKKIFFAIRFWLHEFPHMFDLDSKLVRALQGIQELSLSDPDVDSSDIDLSNKDSYTWMSEAHMSVRPNQLSRKRRKVSLVFNHVEPEEIAIHMSYLEYKSFRRLTLSDFHSYTVHGAVKDNLKLERVVFLFNNITHWVQCMILDHRKPQERANAIVKFVEVAKKLSAMRNFNTLMAIVGALTHTAIARLKKTMAAVPKDTVKTLEEFVELLDSKSNYCGYRRAYGQVSDEFKIPVIGILMKDLIALHAALADRVGDGLINVRKMVMIGGIFQELLRLQRYSFPYDVNRDLVNTLRVSLYLYYNEEEIYQLSLAREPRDVKHSTSGLIASPSKMVNMGFGEFASFTCQLDDDTIKQHVTAMVGSVFKAYDENSDGFISEVEFENFIQNFPGLDSFDTVDKDQDGRISRSEMVDYFLKISSTRRNQVCQSFKHDFVETTYYHPVFCEECEKLLWGLVKQGWKCRGCGINCHKHCKDRIVQECRPKISQRSLSSASQMSKKKQREKTSVSSESDFSVNGELTRAASHDEETFDASDSKAFASPDGVSRSISMPASAITSNLHPGDKGKKVSSKTPPPLRKSTSPPLTREVGRRSLQKKVQSMIKKKNSKSMIVTDPGSPAPHISSFLHGKSPSDESSKFPDMLESINESERSAPSAEANAPRYGQQVMPERRDSGLSGCSCTTLSSRSISAPVTPVLYEKTGGETSFQYPAATNPATISTSPPSGHMRRCLFEENEKLRQENERLRHQLLSANDVIAKLKEKLSHSRLT